VLVEGHGEAKVEELGKGKYKGKVKVVYPLGSSYHVLMKNLSPAPVLEEVASMEATEGDEASVELQTKRDGAAEKRKVDSKPKPLYRNVPEWHKYFKTLELLYGLCFDQEEAGRRGVTLTLTLTLIGGGREERRPKLP